jgi:hypothetical protein
MTRVTDVTLIALDHSFMATLWGSSTRLGCLTCRFVAAAGRGTGGDLAFVGEPTEDLPSLDPVYGEVDRLRWPALGLGWCELAEGAVGACGVVMP